MAPGNRDLLQKLPTTVADNSAFLKSQAPGNPQILAQVQALTQQINDLITLVLGYLPQGE